MMMKFQQAEKCINERVPKSWLWKMLTVFGSCVAVVITVGVAILVVQGQADHKYALAKDMAACQSSNKEIKANQQNLKEDMAEMKETQKAIWKKVGTIQQNVSDMRSDQKVILRVLERLENECDGHE